MAFLCENCRVYFTNNTTSCPYCGRRVFSENISQEALSAEGYSLADICVPKNKTQKDAPTTIDASDIIASLRSTYRRDHSQTSRSQYSEVPRGQATSLRPNNGNDFRACYSGSPITPLETASNAQQPPTAEHAENDFFAQFQSSNNSYSVPTSESIFQNTSITPYDNDVYRTPPQVTRRRRSNLGSRHFSLLDLLGRINWRIIFRILLILGVACCVVTIWKMRYVILNSVFNFCVSLIPLVLVIAIIVYLIKSIFR